MRRACLTHESFRDFVAERHETPWDVGGDWGAYEILARMVDRGVLRGRDALLAPLAPPKKDTEWWPLFCDAYGGGGRRHTLLKYRGARLLYDLGEPTPLFEEWCQYGRADVSAPSLQAFAECGVTPPRRLLRAFARRGYCVKFYVLSRVAQSEQQLVTEITPARELHEADFR